MTFDVKEIISVVGTIVQSAAAVGVALAALRGLSTWRRQIAWQKRFEAACKLLLLAQGFRGALDRARSPIMYPHEWEGRPRDPNESAEQVRILDYQYALSVRLQPVAKISMEMEQAAWEAEIITGAEIMPHVQPFFEVVREVRRANDMLAAVQSLMPRLPPGQAANPVYAKHSEESLKLLFTQEEDDLKQRVDTAIESLRRVMLSLAKPYDR